MKFAHNKKALAAASASLFILAACGGGKGLVVYPDLPSSPGTGSIGSGVNDNFYTDPGNGLATPNCVPSIPVDGQDIKVLMVARDKQGEDNGRAIYPDLTSTITYTFNEGAGTYGAVPSNADYVLSPSGNYNPITGEITMEQEPFLAAPLTDSYVSIQPSDWAQRLAKELNEQPALATAEMNVTLKAKGFLPNLLADIAGGTVDPQSETIVNRLVAKVQRVNDGDVAGITGACRFNFTLYRHSQMDPSEVFIPGNHGSTDSPLQPTAANEDAAISDISVSGSTLSNFSGQRSETLFLEPYMPALEGVFATSNQVPFVPVTLKWTHVYGISSLSYPTYLNTDGLINQRAVLPATAAAFQEFTYVP